MISLSNICMRFGAQVLFEGVNWRLSPRVHYGLVGANGSGKSTLLRIMAGELRPESGTVAQPNDLRLGVLPQDHATFDEQPLLEVVLQGKPALWEALREKQHLLAQYEAQNGDEAEAAIDVAAGERLAELELAIADADGYTAEATATELLEGLGIPEERHRRSMRELSGGYRLRVLLARTLFLNAELLLLDEPTNHLDLVSIRWLEGYLRAYAGTIVLVSHDRHFLNTVCDQIADVDYQELRLYPGNYDRFLQAKALSVEQKEAETGRLEKKIADTQQFIDRFKAKATKARQAGSRQKLVERMARELPQIKPSSRRYPKFRFGCVRASGQEVLIIRDLAKGYDGPPVLENVSLELRRGQRLAVVGPNGIGKSTLLQLVAGLIEPDSGTVAVGYEVHPGYFAQDHHSLLDPKATLVDWLHNESPLENLSTIRGTLGRVLFSGDDADKAIGALSGGESARLLLARLLLRQDNLLILDEPTNHLDLEGREALLEALQGYEGTLLFVSHDRHFVSALADRVLALTAAGHNDFPGGYEEYLAREGADYLEARNARAAKAVSPAGSAAVAGTARGTGQGIVAPTQLTPTAAGRAPAGANGSTASYQHRKTRKRAIAKLTKRVQRLEQEVNTLEAQLAKLEARFAQPGYYEKTPWDEVAAAEQEKSVQQAELEARIASWESASMELEGMGGGS